MARSPFKRARIELLCGGDHDFALINAPLRKGVKKDAGNVFVISGNDQVQTILEQDIDIGGVSASVLNDGGSYKARIMCTGKANENINWYASVKEFVLNFD